MASIPFSSLSGRPSRPSSSRHLDEETIRQLKSRDSEQNRKVVYWIVRTSRRFLPGIVVLMVFSAFNSLAGVAFALVSQVTINSAVAKNVPTLVWSAIGLAVIGIMQILVRSFSQYFTEQVSARVENGYRSRLFGYILDRDFRQVSSYHSGDLMNRMTDDVSIIVSGVTGFLPSVAEIVANLIGAGSVLLLMDWRFLLVYIAATIILIIVNKVFRRGIKYLSAVVRQADGESRSFFQDVIGSLLVFRVFVTEDRAREHAQALLDSFYSSRIKRSRVRIVSNSMMGLSMNFGHIFALVWCSFLLIADQISYGSLVAIIQLTGQVRQPFISASTLSSQYYSMIASGERLMEIENLDPELTAEEQADDDDGFDARSLYASMTRIRFEDVWFGYGDEDIIKGITYTIDKGEFVAIMGQSGSGKSTFFKLILGVFRDFRGTIMLEGQGWQIPLGPRTRRLFAYVPQGNFLISGRLRDNIAFVDREVADEGIWEACRIACADTFIQHLPDGLDTIIGEHGSGLSEGQVQRIAIARAYLSGAPILLLDEATSALDEETEARLLENLDALDDRTCLIVTHRKSALRICDKVLEIQ